MRVLFWLLALVAVVDAQSTARRMFAPGVVGRVQSIIRSTVPADQMTCVVAPAELSLVATKLAAVFNANNPSETCGLAVYPNDDAQNALLTTSGACDIGVLGGSGLPPATITAGTLYRWCVCGENQHVSPGSNGAMYDGVAANLSCCNTSISHLVQAFHAEYFGHATNSCTAGVPPSQTGAIIPDATSPKFNAPPLPIFLIEE